MTSYKSEGKNFVRVRECLFSFLQNLKAYQNSSLQVSTPPGEGKERHVEQGFSHVDAHKQHQGILVSGSVRFRSAVGPELCNPLALPLMLVLLGHRPTALRDSHRKELQLQTKRWQFKQ